MCEVESPLSLSGLLLSDPSNDVSNALVLERLSIHEEKFICDFSSLPQELKLLILSQCTLAFLDTVVTVSKSFYELIRQIVSQVTRFEPQENSPEETGKTFQLLLNHSENLKTILGVCCAGNYLPLSVSDEIGNRFECQPDQLLSLINRNSNLEHVILYDFRVRDDAYFEKLFQALKSCTNLKLLYSESPMGNASKVQEFIEQMKNLSEISFPNICTLKSSLEAHGWFGYFFSSTGILHPRNAAAIQILRKGKSDMVMHSASAPTFAISSISDNRTKLAMSRAPLRTHQLIKGPSLRDSIGSTVPRKPQIVITSE